MAERTQVNAKLDPVLFQNLADYCKRERVDKSSVVRLALRSHLDNSGDISEIKRDLGILTSQYVQLVERLAEILEGGK